MCSGPLPAHSTPYWLACNTGVRRPCKGNGRSRPFGLSCMIFSKQGKQALLFILEKLNRPLILCLLRLPPCLGGPLRIRPKRPICTDLPKRVEETIHQCL